MTHATDMTTLKAAEYCGLSRSGFIKYRQAGRVLPDYREGYMMYFTKANLDKFNATRRKQGRPRKSQAQEATG